MQNSELILADDFCTYHKVEYAFINDLYKFGLIEIEFIDTGRYITHNQLQKLEQIIRLYHDLNINLEGIDVINNLLERLTGMQSEILTLRNRLQLYEGSD